MFSRQRNQLKQILNIIIIRPTIVQLRLENYFIKKMLV